MIFGEYYYSRSPMYCMIRCKRFCSGNFRSGVGCGVDVYVYMYANMALPVTGQLSE